MKQILDFFAGLYAFIALMLFVVLAFDENGKGMLLLSIPLAVYVAFSYVYDWVKTKTFNS